ncbi:hypothetical protein MFMK1_003159 [Metallumcola ferriviriculae]|uniref:Mur ligase central domain-containing protein n=1 Tax=Metallumcola ferriviriculae TaxID=3039180 RepID=A0AAU0USR5_9FIRM|nr:hypothetical protein MFMK1_003159 [Desulfitibacteraceae bacterium MK1]
MSLWKLYEKHGLPNLAVTGLAKNTGKTVTLNYLISAAAKNTVRVGLTSVGRDGETWDLLTKKRKPLIQVAAGTLLSTAENTLSAGTAAVVPLARMGFYTPLGEVILARATSSGTVVLAGPSKVKQIDMVINALKQAGADMVMVDGALDRQSFAAPHITGASVLATGASVASTLDKVAAITHNRIRQFSFALAPTSAAQLYIPGKVALKGTATDEIIPSFRMLAAGPSFWRKYNDVSLAIFGGALTQFALQGIMSSAIDLQRLMIVVKDVTRLMAEGESINRFIAAGGSIKVIKKADLLAVTVNPISPAGRNIDPVECFNKIKEVAEGIPVFDLVAGLGSN